MPVVGNDELLSLLLLALALPAQADTQYCVGTLAQFQDALDQAEVDAGDSLIHVRSGTYQLTSDLRYAPITEFVIPVGRLTVRGGYNADCSSYSLAPGATRINGSGEHLFSAETVTDSVMLAGLTFQSAFLRVQRPAPAECVTRTTQHGHRRHHPHAKASHGRIAPILRSAINGGITGHFSLLKILASRSALAFCLSSSAVTS
jgi:hypothetical protein